MLEQIFVAFVKLFEMLRAITWFAGKQNQVMRTRNSIDAVELHKAQPLNQLEQIRAMGCALGGLQQSVPIQKYPPRGSILQARQAHPRLRRLKVSPKDSVGFIVTLVGMSGSGSELEAFKMIFAAATPISRRQASVVAS